MKRVLIHDKIVIAGDRAAPTPWGGGLAPGVSCGGKAPGPPRSRSAAQTPQCLLKSIADGLYTVHSLSRRCLDGLQPHGRMPVQSVCLQTVCRRCAASYWPTRHSLTGVRPTVASNAYLLRARPRGSSSSEDRQEPGPPTTTARASGPPAEQRYTGNTKRRG